MKRNIFVLIFLNGLTHGYATDWLNLNLARVDYSAGNVSYSGTPLAPAPFTLTPSSLVSGSAINAADIKSIRFCPPANRTITLVADPNNAATWSMANFPLDGVLWVQSGKLEVDINNPNAVNWSGNRARLRLTQGTTFKTHRANVVVSALVHDDRSSDTDNSAWNSWAETTNELLYPTTGGTVEIGYDDGGTYPITDSAMSGTLTINTTDRSQDAVFSGRVSQPAYLRAYGPFSDYPRLYKTGAGKQIFIGNNSGFLGTAEINGGTLQLGDGSQNSFWGGSITVASGGTFQFKPSAVESAADIGRHLKISLNGTLKLPLAANPTLQPVLDVLANNSTSSLPVSSATDYLSPNSPSKQWPYLEFETAIGSTPLPGCYVLIRCPKMEGSFAGNMKTRQPIPNHLLDFKMAIHTPGGKRITAAFAQLLKINEPALVVQSNTEGYEVITDASGNLTTRITHIPRDSNYALPAASGGSSSSAPITLRNYGTGLENPPSTNTYRIQINQIASDNSEFSVGSLSRTNLYQFYSYPTDTPPTVATDNNGSATITFTPASGSVGLRNANITIRYQHILPSGTDPTVYTYRFTVSAMATPQISLTNQAGTTVGSSLLMGRLSATTTTDLNLRNNGSIALNNLNLQILGTDAAAFTATLLDQAGTSVISSLPSATTGTLRLTYNPDLATDYGLSTATLMIRQRTDPAFSTIALSAIRVASLSAPVLQIIDTRDGSRTVLSSNPATPSTVAVPDTVLGRRCATQSLTMRNIGSAVLNISAASLSSGTVFSNATPDLSIAAIDNNGLVDSAPLQVTFTPLPLSGPIPIGTYSDQISVTYNSPGAVYTINLQGDSLNGPFLRVEDPSATPATVLSSNSSYSLPTTFLGSNSQRSLTLRNIGTLPLTFNAPTFSNAAEFSLRNSQGAALTAFSIQGSSSTEALVRVTPTAVGTRSSSLSLTSNSPNSPFALNLTANVTANAFALTDGASPPASVAHNSSIRLPNAVIGASSTATYTLTNTTASALNVTTGLSGSSATEFDAVLRDGMGTVITELGGNSSATLTLSFSPRDNSNSSARTCNLAIGSGPGTTFALQLSATPDAAPLQINNNSLPEANTLNPYSASLTAEGGFTPYSWTLLSGSLPAGLSLGSNGVISGTPSLQADGDFTITVQVTDKLNVSTSKALTLALRGEALVLSDQATPPNYVAKGSAVRLPDAVFGDRSSAIYTLTNTTASAINVATFLSGANAGEFSAVLRTNVGGVIQAITELAANSSATLSLGFQPTDNSSASSRTCNLTIGSGARTSFTLQLNATPLAAALQINNSSLPEATIQTAYSTSLRGQGGLIPYTWALVSGSLPPGLTMASNGFVSGTPSRQPSGSFNFSVQISDAAGTTTTRELTLMVQGDALYLSDMATPANDISPNSTLSLPNAVIGASSSASYKLSNVSDSTLNVTSLLSGAGASEFGAELRDAGGSAITQLAGKSSATLSLRFQPTDNSHANARTCTLRIGSGARTSFTLQLSATPIPATLQINSSGLPNASILTDYRTTLSAQGGVTPYTWTLDSGSLPSGLTLASNGIISGRASRQSGGSFSFTVQVSDASNTTTTRALSLLVDGEALYLSDMASPANDIGQNSTITLPSALIGSSSSASYTLSNAAATPLNVAALLSGADAGEFSAVLRDAGGSVITDLAGKSDATLTLSFRPTNDSNSSARSCNLTLGSGVRTSFTLQLRATPLANSLQITTSSLQEARSQNAYSEQLTAQGGFKPYRWRLASGRLPNGLTLDQNGRISGNPSNLPSGNIALTVGVNDSTGRSTTKMLSLVLRGLDQPLRLSDAATPPNFLADQATLRFPRASIGGVASRLSYRLENLSDASLDVTCALSGSGASNFSVTILNGVNQPISTLAANSTATLRIDLVPSVTSTLGRKVATLTIGSGTGTPLTLFLSGRISNPNAGPGLQLANLSLNEANPQLLEPNSTLAMGATPVGVPVTHKLRVTNISNEPITIGTLMNNAADPQFSFSWGDLPADATLANQQSAVLLLRFLPARAVNLIRRNRLQLVASEPNQPTEPTLFSFNLDLQGQSLDRKLLPQSISLLNPGPLYAGQGEVPLVAQAVGSGLAITLSLKNTSAATLTYRPNAGYRLTPLAEGSVTLTASQSGNEAFAPAKPVTLVLKIAKAPLTLSLAGLVHSYDGTDKEVTILPASLANQGTLSVTYTLGKNLLGSGVKPRQAGTYAVKVVHTPSSGKPVTAVGNLTIAKAALLVTAEAKQRRVLQANPPLTYLLRTQRNAAWVELSDDEAFWTTKPGVGGLRNSPQLTTRAVASSPAGIYPITLANQPVSLNYQPVFIAGSLSIEGFGSSHQALIRQPADNRPLGLLNLRTTGMKSIPGKVKNAPPSLRATFSASLNQSLNPNVPLVTFAGEFELGGNGEVLALASATLSDLKSGIKLSGLRLDRLGILKGSLLYGANSYAIDGIRLLESSEAPQPYAGSYTLLLETGRMADPAENNRKPTLQEAPLGQGYASIAIDAKGWMRMTCFLGDGKSFTAALPADNDSNPGYRLFAQPYAQKSAVIAGDFELLPLAGNSGKRYLPSASLHWLKARNDKDNNYRLGFNLKTTARIDPWMAPDPKTNPLSTLLGSNSLSLTHSSLEDPGSNQALNQSLSVGATSLSFSQGTFKLNPKTGIFSGTRQITRIAAASGSTLTLSFAGCLRQPAVSQGDDQNQLVGAGLLMVPGILRTDPSTCGEISISR